MPVSHVRGEDLSVREHAFVRRGCHILERPPLNLNGLVDVHLIFQKKFLARDSQTLPVTLLF